MLYRYAAATALLAVALGTVAISLPTKAEVAKVNDEASEVSDLHCAPRDRWGATRAPRLNPADQNEAGLAVRSIARAPVLDLAKLPGLSLDRLTHGEPVRIGVWGDSHVAGGLITEELAHVLHSAGVETQTSFIPPLLGHPGVARLPLRKFCISPDWVIEPAYSAKTSASAGLGLASQRSSRRNAHIWLDLRDVSRHADVNGLRIHYVPQVKPALVEVIVDDGPARRVVFGPAGSDGPGSASIGVTGNGGPLSTVKLRVVEGTVQLQGFALSHRHTAQVTLDVFGIPSATARGWVAADAGMLRGAVAGAGYDAIFLEYGTNEGNSPKFTPPSYRAELAESLTAMRRIFPNAACILIGPGDRGVRPGYPVTRKGRRVRRTSADAFKFSRIHAEINAAQAEVGAEFGCQAWDWQAVMGGAGAAREWAAANPPLMGGDLTHLTATGYRATADSLANSLGWLRPLSAR